MVGDLASVQRGDGRLVPGVAPAANQEGASAYFAYQRGARLMPETKPTYLPHQSLG